MDSAWRSGGITCVVVLCLTYIDLAAGSGACFKFTGDGLASFSPENLDISSKAHFKLSFKTVSDIGLLYYAEGTYQRERVYDYEGVFLRNGYLHYFLFNPAEYSIGSSFGFYGKSNTTLNDNKWHTIEFYRNIEKSTMDRYGVREQVEQTGLTVDGVQQAFDNRRRSGVNIFKPVYLGGDPRQDDRAGTTRIGGFKGRIKDFVDVIRNYSFDNPDPMKKQVRHCLPSVPDAV